MDLKSAEYKSRSKENLVLTTAQPVCPVSVIHFEFRPKILENMILQCNVRRNRSADNVLMGQRNRYPNCRLNIEIPPALAAGQGGRDYPGPIGECRGAGRGRETEKRRDDIIAVLLIGA